MAILMSLLATLAHYRSAAQRLEVRSPPAQPFDAIIVPGCPTASDGRLSACQARRAMWAAILWERGYAQHFITSGAAVYSPYVEAETLAAALAALGVPADRIYLDPEALHTEENIYNAVRIARLKGWARLAVASDAGQAVGACQMLEEWHPQCGAFTMDPELVQARLRATDALTQVHSRRLAAGIVPLKQRERARAQAAGRRPRPPSVVLYPLMLLRKGLGLPAWQPFAPAEARLITWDSLVSRGEPP
jgi:hypothetical protein